MNVLVIGGAGYIGSHMCKLLSQHGHCVISLDNLSTGFAHAAIYGKLIVGELADEQLLSSIFTEYSIDIVMHFAAFSQVGESIISPAKYYKNNVADTLVLLNCMVKHNVLKLIFSSTAAIFGHPTTHLISETHSTEPINPYGQSKLMVEQMLRSFDTAYNLKSVCLRYFNAAGADPEGELGENHTPETHLIPLVLQVAAGRRKHLSIFGNDYPTPDGTCIRDYIHIYDLCHAHLLAAHYVINQHTSAQFNLGNGLGYSIYEVIHTAEKVCGLSLAKQIEPRRSGDPAVLVADATHASQILHWKPQYHNLINIIQHAWEWEKKRLTSSGLKH